MHRRSQSLVVEGCRTIGPAFAPFTTAQEPLARDLPETAPRVASPRPTTQPATAPLTCAVVWARGALRGAVNHRRIDGMQGVRGSNYPSS